MAVPDFGPGTIDDESAVLQDFDIHSESEGDDPPTQIQRLPDSKSLKSNHAQDSSSDLNPNFTFSLDHLGPTGTVHPWDFTEARSKLRQRSIVYSSIDDKIAKRVVKNLNGGDNADSDDEIMHDDLHPTTTADSVGTRSDNLDDSSAPDHAESSAEVAHDSSDEDQLDVVRERQLREEKRKNDYFEQVDEPEDEDLPSTFASMHLSRPVIKSLSHLGFTTPTVIQARAIPLALMGKDIVGGAMTGSGKTLAFMIPILERLLYRPKANPCTRVLVITPTRELAIQCHSVSSKVAQFTGISVALAVGGLSVKQQEAELKKRPDILIATPGRLIDFVHNSPSFTLDAIEILVMDEADRMLDDGFADELDEIIKNTPRSRQTMLFSATMTDNIDQLIRVSLTHPVRLFIDSRKATSHRLVQEFVRIRPQREHDRGAILLALCTRTFKSKCIIFFRSKAAAHQMKVLFGLYGLSATELHGNLTQEQRLDALELFRDGKVDFMLATDLAARGIDITGIDTVINYNMPVSHVQYLHRVGRTARAGRGGRSVSLVGEADRKALRMIIKNATSADQIKHRVVASTILDKYAEKVESVKDDIRAVLHEETSERELRQAEQQLNKAKNLMDHKAEIMARPKRQWFQSNADRDLAKDASGAEFGVPAKVVQAAQEASLERAHHRPATSGLSRRKRRRLVTNDDKPALAMASSAVRSVKKANRAQRLSIVAKSFPSSSPKNTSKSKKAKGFESEIGASKPRPGTDHTRLKATGGKGKALAKIKNKKHGKVVKEGFSEEGAAIVRRERAARKEQE